MNNDNDNSFWKVPQKIKKTFLYEKGNGDKLRWFIDLISMAQYCDQTCYKNTNSLYDYEIHKKGTVHTSMSILAGIWGVDRETVKRFLDRLMLDGQLISYIKKPQNKGVEIQIIHLLDRNI